MNITSIKNALYTTKNALYSAATNGDLELGGIVFTVASAFFKNNTYYVYTYSQDNPKTFPHYLTANITAASLAVLAVYQLPRISREGYVNYIVAYVLASLNGLKFLASWVLPTALIYSSLSEIIDKTSLTSLQKQTCESYSAIAGVILGGAAYTMLSRKSRYFAVSRLQKEHMLPIAITSVVIAVIGYPFGIRGKKSADDTEFKTILGYPYGFAPKVDVAKAVLIGIPLSGVFSALFRSMLINRFGI